MPVAGELESRTKKNLANRIAEKIAKIILADSFFKAEWLEKLNHLSELYTDNAEDHNNTLSDEIVTYLIRLKNTEELKEYYDNISKRAKKDAEKQNKPTEIIFKDLFTSLKNLFQGENGGIFIQLMNLVHKLQVGLNPGAPFSKEEEKGKYSAWFSEFGDNGRALYRKAIEAKYTEKQRLSVLLSKIKKEGWCEKKDSHKLLKKIEKEVFVGINSVEECEEKVRGYLKAAAVKAGINVDDQDSVHGKLFEKACKNVKKLAETIQKQKAAIKAKDGFSKSEKQELYKTMQNNRLILLYSFIKFQALGEEKILSVNDENKDFAKYFEKQLRKFDEPPPRSKKGILRSLANGNYSDDYDNAIAKVRENRVQEIKKQKEKLSDTLNGFLQAAQMITTTNPDKVLEIKTDFQGRIAAIPDNDDSVRILNAFNEHKANLDKIAREFSYIKETFIAHNNPRATMSN